MLRPSRNLPNNKWKATLVTPTAAPTNKDLPNIVDEYNLCNLLGYNGKYPWYVVHHTDSCYSNFWINKDTKRIVSEFNPDLRLREISAPTGSLKVLQGRLAALIFSKLPKHEANFAYMSGKNVRNAAEEHENNKVLIRIDLKDFFPRHNEHYVRTKLRQLTGYSKELCWFITKLCSLKGCLPQGSVTSPILSVVLNYEMDVAIGTLAAKYGLKYTRYADDLCFSGADAGNKVYWDFIRKLAEVVHPFNVNWDKVEIMRNSAYRYLNGVKFYGSALDLSKLEDHFCGMGMGLKVKTKRGSLELTTITELSDGDYAALVGLANSMFPEITVKPHYYFVQSIKRLLGMHLTDGIKYPREKYISMRMIANMIVNGSSKVNIPEFKGRLSFMRLIDPNKASKIDKILSKNKEEVASNGNSVS